MGAELQNLGTAVIKVWPLAWSRYWGTSTGAVCRQCKSICRGCYARHSKSVRGFADPSQSCNSPHRGTCRTCSQSSIEKEKNKLQTIFENRIWCISSIIRVVCLFAAKLILKIHGIAGTTNAWSTCRHFNYQYGHMHQLRRWAVPPKRKLCGHVDGISMRSWLTLASVHPVLAITCRHDGSSCYSAECL